MNKALYKKFEDLACELALVMEGPVERTAFIIDKLLQQIAEWLECQVLDLIQAILNDEGAFKVFERYMRQTIGHVKAINLEN